MRILFLVIFLTGLQASAQIQDANLWTGVGLKARIYKKLDLKYETQTRFYKNATTLSQYYNEVGLKYELLDGLGAGATYRYSRKNKESFYVGGHRLTFSLGYGFKIKPLSIRLKVKAKYQHSIDRLDYPNEFVYPDEKNSFRFKFELKYKNADFKLIQPYVSYEMYYAIQPLNPVSSLDTYRVSAGLDFDLPNKHGVSLYYIFEHENREEIRQNHIYCLQYNYSFGKIFKKKKNGSL